MNELLTIESGPKCATNQVLYNLQHRQVEFDLLPWSQQNKIPIMAYSPVGHGRGLVNHATLKEIGKKDHDATAAQIALAWVFRQPGVIAIPKASTEAHVRENARAVELNLSTEDLARIAHEFPPPKSEQPLPTL